MVVCCLTGLPCTKKSYILHKIKEKGVSTSVIQFNKSRYLQLLEQSSIHFPEYLGDIYKQLDQHKLLKQNFENCRSVTEDNGFCDVCITELSQDIFNELQYGLFCLPKNPNPTAPERYIHLTTSVSEAFRNCAEFTGDIYNPFVQVLGGEYSNGASMVKIAPGKSIRVFRRIEKIYADYYRNKRNVYYVNASNSIDDIVEMVLEITRLR